MKRSIVALIIIWIFTLLVLAGIVFRDIRSFQNERKPPQKETPQENVSVEGENQPEIDQYSLKPHELPDLPEPEIPEKELTEEEKKIQERSDNGLLCDYITVKRPDYTQIDEDDDVQEIIGYQNNKVGLYIYAEVDEFTEKAAEMANSNGGEWGYVLIPYNVKDYDESRWNKVFARLSEEKLIPIIQLWDIDLDNEEKTEKQISDSARFLNNLEWPITNRYVSVYNEPNDADFWKGKVDPEGYARILNKTIDALKSQNKNFFVMNAAFNASARSGGKYLDESAYLLRMNQEVPGIFRKLDGWASHPYPQPNFSGSPRASGRDSIKAYEWELGLLKKYYGVDNIPVFITETGWAHKESEAHEEGQRVPYSLNQYQVADNMKYAFEEVWLPDDRVVAVTPFTVRYNPPYDNFSWITQNNNNYPQLEAVKNIKKVEGKPPTVTYHSSKVLECVYE